jgi:hypothetical protein
MYTSVMLVALSASFAHAAIPVGPVWRTDYSLALKECQRGKLPLAIFVAKGAEGWQKVSKDGELDRQTKEVLLTRYVCVYIDATTEKGQRLAEQLELSNGRGLVISDSTGEKQAFWHDGKLSNEDLNHYLTRYADPDRVVTRTETVPAPRPQYQYTAPPTYYQPVMPSFGGCRS